MSIYRRFDREPLNDVHAKPIRQAEERAPPVAPQPTTRHVEPPVEPLDLTIQWVAKLPRDVRPMTLMRSFARIANKMAALWPEPEALHDYINELFVDRRGNRQGFPPEVMAELFALRSYYEDLHPAGETRWDDSHRHR